MSWGIKNATNGAPMSGRAQRLSGNRRGNAKSRRMDKTRGSRRPGRGKSKGK